MTSKSDHVATQHAMGLRLLHLTGWADPATLLPPDLMDRVERIASGPVPAIPFCDFRDSSDAEALLLGWGQGPLDEDLLSRMPALRVVFYLGGSIRVFATEALWSRGIRVVSGWRANALPVAQYVHATVLLSLTGFWPSALASRRGEWHRPHGEGVTGASVGLIGFGAVARLVAERLRAERIEVVVHDPTLPESVPLTSLFAECDVVSVHAPWLPETVGMVTGELVRSMRSGATLINTSRGAVMCEEDVQEALADRPDLTAILDVTYPEPPSASSPLRRLPNVVLTPHIAGAFGRDNRLIGEAVVGDLERYVQGGVLENEVTRDMAARMA